MPPPAALVFIDVKSADLIPARRRFISNIHGKIIKSTKKKKKKVEGKSTPEINVANGKKKCF